MPSAPRHPGLHTIEVNDLDDPSLGLLLEPYRNQKDTWLRAQRDGGTGLADGLFLAEGELVVRTLLASPCRVVSVLCTPNRLDAMHAELASLPTGTPVLVASRGVVERILGFDMHRGILALGSRADPPTAEQLIARSRVLVVCEDLANHDNVGAVFRNTACLVGGGAGVLLSPGCCDPLYRKSLRVSMGHALRVPFARLEPWPEGLGALIAGGFELVALTPDDSAEDISTYEHTPDLRPALLVGTEGRGLGAAAMASATRRLSIPMAAGTDSLNVATALAVVLSRLVRPE